MNLGEITDTIKLISGKASATDMEEMIRNDVNRAYRKLCRARTFGALVHRSEQITTVAATMTYVLPYPLDRILDDTLRYDVTSTTPGTPIELREAGSSSIAVAASIYPAGAFPVVASIGRGNQSPYSDGLTGASITIAANDTVTSSALFSSGMVGFYIRFGTDATGRNGGDYGYLLETFNSTSSLSIAAPYYRGPSLTNAGYEIRPATSKWLNFDPIFTDTAKVIQFDWYSKPARLYNAYDVPEVQELSDAIVYRVLCDNPIYHRPASYDQLNYDRLAREYLVSAIKTALQ